jgi:hypothetical protein
MNVASSTALNCGNEICIINQKKSQKVEVAHILFWITTRLHYIGPPEKYIRNFTLMAETVTVRNLAYCFHFHTADRPRGGGGPLLCSERLH